PLAIGVSLELHTPGSAERAKAIPCLPPADLRSAEHLAVGDPEGAPIQRHTRLEISYAGAPRNAAPAPESISVEKNITGYQAALCSKENIPTQAAGPEEGAAGRAWSDSRGAEILFQIKTDANFSTRCNVGCDVAEGDPDVREHVDPKATFARAIVEFAPLALIADHQARLGIELMFPALGLR